MALAHEPGCDRRHTSRQACVQITSAARVAGAHAERRAPYPRGRTITAFLLELAPALAAGTALLFIQWWSPVERGQLPPSAPESALLLAVSVSFVIAGLGWLYLRLAWVSVAVILIRAALALVMLGGFLDTFMYDCDGAASCENGDGWRLFQVAAAMMLALPAASALALGVFAAIRRLQD